MKRQRCLQPLAVVMMLSITMLACNTAVKLPNLFASPTPTATATFTPSPTPTLTPSPTALPTGTDLQQLADGSTQFIDYDGKYIISIPSNWIAVQPDGEDIKAMAAEFASSNPQLSEAFKAVQNLSPDVFRLVAYDKDPRHYANSEVTNFNVGLDIERTAAVFPLDLLIQATMDQAKSKLPTAKFTSLGIKSNKHDLKIGVVEIEFPVKSPGGSQIIAYEKQMYFQTKNALVVVTFTTSKSIADLTSPAFDELFDAIDLIHP